MILTVCETDRQTDREADRQTGRLRNGGKRKVIEKKSTWR